MAFTKMLWAEIIPSVIKSWRYWVAQNLNDFLTINPRNYKKSTNGCAFFAAVKTTNNYTILLVSLDTSSVRYLDDNGNTYNYKGQFSAHNVTWDWAGFDLYGLGSDSWPYAMSDKTYAANVSGGEQAAKDLVDMVCSIPFHENYQIGDSYHFNNTDVESTIRKICGYFLLDFGESGIPSVIALGQQIESIVQRCVSEIQVAGNINGVIYCEISLNTATNKILLYVDHGYIDPTTSTKTNDVDNAQINAKLSNVLWYEAYSFKDKGQYDQMTFEKTLIVEVDNYGNVGYNYTTNTSRPCRIGVYYNPYGGSRSISNLGLDL